MRISIVGTGYVGLVSGACLAARGHDVTCIDLDRDKVDAINAGRAPFHEQGLPELLKQVVGRTLHATTDLRKAVVESDATLIAVGTPAVNGRIDLTDLLSAAGEIGAAIRSKTGYHAVIVKSTVVPGTTDGAVRNQLEQTSGLDAGSGFGLGMNPEFLTEGQAVRDFFEPDRIVIGGSDPRMQNLLGEIYANFPGTPRITTNNTTAEFIKYASNAVLATMISFSNELSRLCMVVGDVDIADVMEAVHQSSYFTTRSGDREAVRAGITSFLSAGCGFGGSCLPKDVTALIGHGSDHGLAMPLLQSVIDTNQSQPEEMIKLMRRHFPSLKGRRVALLGVAFKPDTDDVRESPAFPIARRLIEEGASVVAYDPLVREDRSGRMPGVAFAASLEQAVASADVVALVTSWPQFAGLDALIAGSGRKVLVVDGRRMLSPGKFAEYEGIGRNRSGEAQASS